MVYFFLGECVLFRRTEKFTWDWHIAESEGGTVNMYLSVGFCESSLL